MKNLRASLIRLGEEAPELQEEIAPILDEIDGTRKRKRAYGDYEAQLILDAIDTAEEEAPYVDQMVETFQKVYGTDSFEVACGNLLEGSRIFRRAFEKAFGKYLR